MTGYTKELLVDAYLHSYAPVLLNFTAERMDAFVKMANDFYDSVGRDKFRIWCSLDSEQIRKFKLETNY